MTTGKKNALGALAVTLAIPFLSVVFATGAANRELASKEGRLEHEQDQRAALEAARVARSDAIDSVREERRIRQLQQVRDSAQMATVLARVTDLSCDNNPRRSYCGRDRQ